MNNEKHGLPGGQALPRPDPGRARPPGGPSELPSRINLSHTPPGWVKNGSAFFVTVCCESRGTNQLCREPVASMLFDAARYYHERGMWYLRVLVLMPDHMHTLISPAPDRTLAKLVGDWKRFTAMRAGVVWQKNFVDHRLRAHESIDEKAHYIRMNPIRAGLISAGESWPYLIEPQTERPARRSGPTM